MNKMKSRTSLVLMELIICILFFSLASAVCVQLFVKAHTTSAETRELNNAINIAQSICEVMKGTDGSIESVEQYFENASGDDDYFVILYDSDFKETDDYDKAAYAADVTIDRISRLYNLEVKVIKLPDCNVIYSLDSSRYVR